MRSDCPRTEDILLAHGSGTEHGLRTHLDACVRCRVLLAAHDRFLADPPAADADETARVADAGRRLATFTAALHTPGDRRRRSWTWPLGLAAVIVVATGFWLLFPDPEAPPHDGTLPAAGQIWRGDGSGGMSDPPPAAELLADGGLRLGWTAVDGAERYEVVLLGADLTELSRWDAGRATSLTIAAEALADGAPAGFFVVAAYAAERELGHWAPVPLP